MFWWVAARVLGQRPPPDSSCAPQVLYGTPAIWVLLGVVAVIGLEFSYLILVIIAVLLSSANLTGYLKCSKAQRAQLKGMATGLFTTGLRVSRARGIERVGRPRVGVVLFACEVGRSKASAGIVSTSCQIGAEGVQLGGRGPLLTWQCTAVTCRRHSPGHSWRLAQQQRLPWLRIVPCPGAGAFRHSPLASCELQSLSVQYGPGGGVLPPVQSECLAGLGCTAMFLCAQPPAKRANHCVMPRTA